MPDTAMDNLFQEMTGAEFEGRFPDEDACCAFLVAQRWPNGVRCPRCSSARVGAAGTMKWRWTCAECGKGGSYRFSHLTGTVFENTKLPLHHWFRILHLMLGGALAQRDASGSVRPVSAFAIYRAAGFGSYHAVWCMCDRLRGFLELPDFRQMMRLALPSQKVPVAEPAANEAPADTSVFA